MELGRRFREPNDGPSSESERHPPSTTASSSPRSMVSQHLSLFSGIFDSWWWIGEQHDDASSSASQTPASIEEHWNHSKSHHKHRIKIYAQGSDSFAADKDNEMDGRIDNDDDMVEKTNGLLQSQFLRRSSIL